MRSRSLRWALAIAVVALGGSGLQAAPERAPVRVMIADQFAFDPRGVTIHAGDTIVWRNTSGFRHTVTDDPALAGQKSDAVLPLGAPAFSSRELDPDDTFQLTLTVPGIYHYFCRLHEGIGMTGAITVLPAS